MVARVFITSTWDIAQFNPRVWLRMSQMVRLPRLAAMREHLQLTAAHHSENSDGFPGRENRPVNGMSF
jgi:hypothetical protein